MQLTRLLQQPLMQQLHSSQYLKGGTHRRQQVLQPMHQMTAPSLKRGSRLLPYHCRFTQTAQQASFYLLSQDWQAVRLLQCQQKGMRHLLASGLRHPLPPRLVDGSRHVHHRPLLVG